MRQLRHDQSEDDCIKQAKQEAYRQLCDELHRLPAFEKATMVFRHLRRAPDQRRRTAERYIPLRQRRAASASPPVSEDESFYDAQSNVDDDIV